jgi:hypothetical protein
VVFVTGLLVGAAIGVVFALIGAIAEGNPFDHGPNMWGGDR